MLNAALPWGRRPAPRHGGCTVPCTASSSTPLVTGLYSRCRGCPCRVWHTSNLCLPCQERPRNGWPFMCLNKWFATVSDIWFYGTSECFREALMEPAKPSLPRTGLKTLQAISPSSSHLSHSTRLILLWKADTCSSLCPHSQHNTKESSWNELHFWHFIEL